MSVCGAKDLVSFNLGVDDLKLEREGGRGVRGEVTGEREKFIHLSIDNDSTCKWRYCKTLELILVSNISAHFIPPPPPPNCCMWVESQRSW